MRKTPRIALLLSIALILMLLRSVSPWMFGVSKFASNNRQFRSSTAVMMTVKKRIIKPENWQLKKIKLKQVALEKSVEDSLQEPANVIPGLVIERMGDRLLVELLDGTLVEGSKLIHCAQRSYLENANLVAGDKVKVDLQAIGTCQGLVTSMEERFSILQRPAVDSSIHKVKMKAIACNVDQLFIITAVAPSVPSSTLDRYIVAAHAYGIPNIALIVNKMDLSGSKELLKGLKYYTTLGYKVIGASIHHENGLKPLQKLLNNQTSVFVGQSGVGKSSLINAILPGVNIKTHELISKKDVGAHTTSNCHLYHLPTGGDIIDSPGIRELGTWHLSREDIRKGFKEIDEFAHGCKFANCQHLSEPEKFCAVKRAVDEGHIHPERVNSYYRMSNS